MAHRGTFLVRLIYELSLIEEEKKKTKVINSITVLNIQDYCCTGLIRLALFFVEIFLIDNLE